MITKNTDIARIKTAAHLTRKERRDAEHRHETNRLAAALDARIRTARHVNSERGINGPRVAIGSAYVPPSISRQYTHVRSW